MASYVHDTAYFSRRTVVLIAIVGFHVLLVYLLASGLARKIVQAVAPPITTDIIEEVKPREEPPPPPPPEFQRPQVEIPPPEVHIDIPVEPTQAITDVTTKPVPKLPPAPPAPRSVVHAGLGKNTLNPDDFYPPSSIRLEEEGNVTVHACVAPNGRLAEAPRVERSSRSARLDDAALKYARAIRYSAGSIDGQPTTDCFSYLVKFQLKK
jgi:periplasmic protein TonB